MIFDTNSDDDDIKLILIKGAKLNTKWQEEIDASSIVSLERLAASHRRPIATFDSLAGSSLSSRGRSRVAALREESYKSLTSWNSSIWVLEYEFVSPTNKK